MTIFWRLFYYTAAGVSAVWLRSPCIYIVQIIFHFFWDHGAHCGIFKNGVLLMYMYILEGVTSVANLITAYEESE